MDRMTVSYISNDADRNLRADAMTAFSNASMQKAVHALIDANGYIEVATIEYDDRTTLHNNLEHAFKLMQNGVVTDSWTLNPPDGLEPLVEPHILDGKQYGHRSFSMGDMIKIGDDSWICAAYGFIKSE